MNRFELRPMCSVTSEIVRKCGTRRNSFSAKATAGCRARGRAARARRYCSRMRNLVSGRGSPQCLQGDDLIVQLTGGQREKGERAARFEVDAYNRRQAGRIEDDEFRMRTTDQAAAKAL